MELKTRLRYGILVVASSIKPVYVSAVTADTIYVVPRSCSSTGCIVPVVDGIEKYFGAPYDYADGFRLTMQDFSHGGPNGRAMLVADGDSLFLYFITYGDCSQSGGEFPQYPAHTLELFFEGDRALRDTQYPVPNRPNQADRHITISYNCTSTTGTRPVTVHQDIGDGSQWKAAKPTEMWPIQHKAIVTYPGSDISKSEYSIEISVQLKPASVVEQSEAMARGRLGLGARFRGTSHEYTLPNNVNGPNALSPSTWQDVYFHSPPQIPLSVMTYNAGQLPNSGLVGVFVTANQGTGQIEDFARIAASSEVTCFQELWPHSVRRSVFEEWRKLAVKPGFGTYAVGMPEYQGLIMKTINSLIGTDTQDTGLLLLSNLPIIDGEVREFDHSNCYSWDCYEDKGMVWARVLTSVAKPESPGNCAPDALGGNGLHDMYCPPSGWNGHHFVDVFCTHLDANDDGSEDRKARAQQIMELVSFIKEKRATDRPAILMGDFNINGNSGSWNSGDSEYEYLVTALNLHQLSSFDTANSWLSDRYDLGLTPPLLTTQLKLASDPVAEATTLDDAYQIQPVGDDSNSIVVPCKRGGARYDFIFILPATDSFPSFGVSKDPEPVVHVEDYREPRGHCYSDHAALSTQINLVEITALGRWNFKKDHRVLYRISRVENLTGDCFLCGEADFIGNTYFPDVNGNFSSVTFREIKNRDEIYPNWAIEADLPKVEPGTTSPIDFSTIFMLLENDTSSTDDHYDTTDIPESRNSFFRLFQQNGQWMLMDGFDPWRNAGTFDGTTSLILPTVGTDHKDERAVVLHEMIVEEID